MLRVILFTNFAISRAYSTYCAQGEDYFEMAYISYIIS